MLDLLQRIDESLEKMRNRGHSDRESYKELLKKRDLVASGKISSTIDVLPALIAGFGAMIMTTIKRTNGTTKKISLKELSEIIDKHS